MFESIDALITDISSVGLDYLYLHPSKPIVITDRRTNRENLYRDAPISKACHVIDKKSIKKVSELLQDALQNDSNASQREIMRRFYFGNLTRGESTKEFQLVVTQLMEERQNKLVNFRGWHS